MPLARLTHLYVGYLVGQKPLRQSQSWLAMFVSRYLNIPPLPDLWYLGQGRVTMTSGNLGLLAACTPHLCLVQVTVITDNLLLYFISEYDLFKSYGILTLGQILNLMWRHFPQLVFGDAAWFKQIKIINDTVQYSLPLREKEIFFSWRFNKASYENFGLLKTVPISILSFQCPALKANYLFVSRA